MTYQEMQSVPEVVALRPQLEAAGLDFGASVEKAVDNAYKRQYAVPTSAKSEIIAFVVDFLIKLVDERMAKPAKTKGGFVTRLLWGVAKIFGARQKVIDTANKL